MAGWQTNCSNTVTRTNAHVVTTQQSGKMVYEAQKEKSGLSLHSTHRVLVVLENRFRSTQTHCYSLPWAPHLHVLRRETCSVIPYRLVRHITLLTRESSQLYIPRNFSFISINSTHLVLHALLNQSNLLNGYLPVYLHPIYPSRALSWAFIHWCKQKSS